MDRAEADRRDEDIQRVVALEQVERQIDRDAADMDRAEVRYDRPVPAEPTADDGDNVAEEAAGQEAYDECGNAAFDQQPRGVFHAPLRLCLPEEEQSRDQQYQAVRHIREHDAEEQREKRHDKGVGVKSVVRRERIHLRDDVVRTGQRVIAQLDGDLLRVLRIGLLRFPGAAVFRESLAELFLLRRGEPAFKIEGAVRLQELFGRLFARNARRERVRAELQRVAVRRVGGKLFDLFGRLGRQLLAAAERGVINLLRRSGALRQRNGRKAERPQRRGDRFAILPAEEQRYIPAGFVLGNEIKADLQLRERGVYFLHGDSGGKCAELHFAALRLHALKRDVQRRPRSHGLRRGAFPACAGEKAARLRIQREDLSRQSEIGGQSALVEQLGAFDLRFRRKQALFGRGVLVQQPQRVDDCCLFRALLPDLSAVRTPEGRQLLPVRPAGRIRHLHAAEKHQLTQQFFLLGMNADEPELFHGYNAHLSVHDPFHDPVCRLFQTVLRVTAQRIHLLARRFPDLFTFRSALFLCALRESPELCRSSFCGFLHSCGSLSVGFRGNFLCFLRRFRLFSGCILFRLLYGKNCFQCHFLKHLPSPFNILTA